MNFKLGLTEQDANMVLQALAKLPLEQSIGLFTKIKNECETQLKNDTD